MRSPAQFHGSHRVRSAGPGQGQGSNNSETGRTGHPVRLFLVRESQTPPQATSA